MDLDYAYQSRLSKSIADLGVWAREHKDVAEIETPASYDAWVMKAAPHVPGACSFTLALRRDNKFDAVIGGETFAGKPIGKFEFFPMLARAIAAGCVEQITVLNALTGTTEAIETRVTLEDGWAWIGERRFAPRNPTRANAAQEMRTRCFLPYRR